MAAWIPADGCLARATAQQTAMIASVVHLYTDALTPSPTTVKADYVAAEADFDDYAPLTVAAWYDPILSSVPGYQIVMPSQQFAQGATDPAVSNIIRGYYILDAGGDLQYAGRFDQDVPVAVAHAGVPVEVIDQFLVNFPL